jgi:hypothetical protein
MLAATMRLRLALQCFSVVPEHQCTGATRREIVQTWAIGGIGLSLVAVASIPLAIGFMRRARVMREADRKLQDGWDGPSLTLQPSLRAIGVVLDDEPIGLIHGRAPRDIEVVSAELVEPDPRSTLAVSRHENVSVTDVAVESSIGDADAPRSSPSSAAAASPHRRRRPLVRARMPVREDDRDRTTGPTAVCSRSTGGTRRRGRSCSTTTHRPIGELHRRDLHRVGEGHGDVLTRRHRTVALLHDGGAEGPVEVVDTTRLPTVPPYRHWVAADRPRRLHPQGGQPLRLTRSRRAAVRNRAAPDPPRAATGRPAARRPRPGGRPPLASRKDR